MSSYGTNPYYRRTIPPTERQGLWVVLDLSCFLWLVVVIALVLIRIHFVGDNRAPVCSCDLFDRPELGRTLAAHRYGNIAREMTFAEQMEDSVTMLCITCFPRYPISLWERPIGI